MNLLFALLLPYTIENLNLRDDLLITAYLVLLYLYFVKALPRVVTWCLSF